MSGMTLLELLCVICIIGIVVSMSLPAYLNARNQAQKISCRVALRSYAIKLTDQGRFIIEIPQEANCHDCHRPRYEAERFLDTVTP